MHYETVHTEERRGFQISLSMAQETDAPDWYFESPEDEVETLRKIDAGIYLWFIARVDVHKRGILLSSDYLGGCCYESVKDFIDCGYFADMADTAIADAETVLKKLSA